MFALELPAAYAHASFTLTPVHTIWSAPKEEQQLVKDTENCSLYLVNDERDPTLNLLDRSPFLPS